MRRVRGMRDRDQRDRVWHHYPASGVRGFGDGAAGVQWSVRSGTEVGRTGDGG